MSNSDPDIVDVLSGVYQRISVSGITIICLCAALDDPFDPFDVRSFRYQSLLMVHNINKVNLAVHSPFGNNVYRGDRYYLDLVLSAFADLDKVGQQFIQTIEDTSATSASFDTFICEKVISLFALIARPYPTATTLDLRSLPKIISEPLPRERSCQIAIIREYFELVAHGISAFQEAFRLGMPDTISWSKHGFADRTQYIKQFLLPMFLYQQLSGAHFLRWLMYSWQKIIRPNFPALDSSSLIYDPVTSLGLKPENTTPGFPNIVWSCAEVNTHITNLIIQQENSERSQILKTRQLQFFGLNLEAAFQPAHQFGNCSTARDSASSPLLASSTQLGTANFSPRSVDLIDNSIAYLTNDTKTIYESKYDATSLGTSTTTPSPARKLIKINSQPSSAYTAKKQNRQSHLTCSQCLVRVTLPKDMRRHLKSIHGVDGKDYYCPLKTCKRSRSASKNYPFDRLDNWRRHVGTVHRDLGFADKDCIVVDGGDGGRA